MKKPFKKETMKEFKDSKIDNKIDRKELNKINKEREMKAKKKK